MIAIPSASLEYRTRGAKPACAAFFITSEDTGRIVPLVHTCHDPQEVWRSPDDDAKHEIRTEASSHPANIFDRSCAKGLVQTSPHCGTLFLRDHELIVLRYWSHRQGFEVGSARH